MVNVADWTVDDEISEVRKEMWRILAQIPRASRKDKENLRARLAELRSRLDELQRLRGTPKFGD